MEQFHNPSHPWEKFLPLVYVYNTPTLWEKKGRVHIWDIESGHFVAIFYEDVDYSRAFFEGSWLVGDHNVISEEW
ncbi:hypothetical protein LINPERHAP1_LOCUS24521 [Linum perenne]